MNKRTGLLLALAIAMSGCATKHYGREGILTPYEEQNMTCKEADTELAKCDGFVEQVNSASAFSGLDVLAVLGDFGIGNAIERDAALKSATARRDQLNIWKKTQCEK